MIEQQKTLVNDIHSQLNPVWVDEIVSPTSVEEVCKIVKRAKTEGKTISIAGGRHASGSQQFGSDTILIDMRQMNKVLNFDPDQGHVEVEAGIQWPALIADLIEIQVGQSQQWGIAQKQTGADRLSIGGALAANVHGRGLQMKPMIADVESFDLIDTNGDLHTCNRQENAELFKLAIGGYGVFGIITTVVLRLTKRQKVERIVEEIYADHLMKKFEQRIEDGFLYGDFQFNTDTYSEDFLLKGVFSTYCPVDPTTPIKDEQREITSEQWSDLIYLAHVDSLQAYNFYAGYYLSTSGQVYWSDSHQLSEYPDDYHHELDEKMGVTDPASEVITEIYVPREQLADFLLEVRDDFRKNNVQTIYGTIRLIEHDDESFMVWAKENYVCIIFNLHTVHTSEGIEHSANAFRRLIDIAIRRGGNYYLTYHRYATREQVLTCYPQFPEFLRLKKQYDPEERFHSNWYRHYRDMFSDMLS